MAQRPSSSQSVDPELHAGRELAITVCGVPYGLQTARKDGLWLSDDHMRQIRRVAPGASVTHISRTDLEAGRLPEEPPEVLLVQTSGSDTGADGIPGIVNADQVRRLITPSLRWVQSASAGIELIEGLFPAHTVVTHAGGVHAKALAESVFAGILFHAKQLEERRRLQRRRVWEWAQLPASELAGSTITILGTGHIGRAVARRAKAFDLRVVGVRRTGVPVAGFDVVVGPSRFREILSKTEYLVVACPLTPETEGLVGMAELTCLPRGAFVANVGRGRVIDEPSLIDMLVSGHLGGAYLDVVSEEPLPSSSPLWTLPSVILVPHDSHASQYIGDHLVVLFCRNLSRYLGDEDLENVVDFERGY